MQKRKYENNSDIDVGATIRFNESELRALEALVGYGTDGFLKVFYKQMGEHYLKPHEAGLRSLFATVRSEVPMTLHRADAARAAFRQSGRAREVDADKPQPSIPLLEIYPMAPWWKRAMRRAFPRTITIKKKS